jgi:hypothetical protein
LAKRKSKSEAPPEEEKIEHKLIEEPVMLPTDEAEPADDEEGFTVKRMPWTLRIEGLDVEIPLSGMKLPMFSLGSADGGEMLIETLNIIGNTLNSYLNKWLRSPSYKKLTINVLDPIGTPLEVWRMEAKPTVMGFSPLDIQDDAPWVTQMVLVARDITIDPPDDVTQSE